MNLERRKGRTDRNGAVAGDVVSQQFKYAGVKSRAVFKGKGRVFVDLCNVSCNILKAN